jgi:DNA topoisomerase-1
MPKSLVIVESPTKARTLTKYLGADFEIKASMGHLIDLPKSKLGVDLDDGFEPQYAVIRGKEKVLRGLREAAKGVKAVFLAPDPDREGEAIAWHISQSLGRGSKFHRVLLFEITKDAVREAFAKPQSIDERKVEAQQARRILDRLVGYKVSPLLWKALTHMRGLSAGRVQTVALRLICEREKEIESFRPQEYWSIGVRLVGEQGVPFEAQLTAVDGARAEIKDADTAHRIAGELRECLYRVQRVERKEKRRFPPPPHTTSSMQQEASRALRFSASKTMRVAQQLYEGLEIGAEGPVGLITYMRTDSVRVADEALGQAREHIERTFGGAYLPGEPRFYREKENIQGAHEAIRPTAPSRAVESVQAFLSPDQLRLYELVWKRFLASQMNPALYQIMVGEIKAGGAGMRSFLLRASGSHLAFDGFLRLYPASEQERAKTERILPPLVPDEELRLLEVAPRQHFTEPPPRYTEASLIKELERLGIGRPSTYAPIMEVIQERDYVSRDDGRFRPTELGRTVEELLVDLFPDIFSVSFTAEMETELDKIEEGGLTRQQVLANFYAPFSETLAKVESDARSLRRRLEKPAGESCERCGKPMLLKWGRYGRFLACSGYPECTNTRPLAKEEQPGAVCETCGAPMAVRRGRFGSFLACTNYPGCRSTRPLSTNIRCPEAGCEGMLVERRANAKGKKARGRANMFYGCSRYPDCRFAIWDRPVDRSCPECQAPFLVEEKRTKRLKCPRCQTRVPADRGASSVSTNPESSRTTTEDASSWQ